MPTADVIVVGKGNAALCAALAARESGARVLMLEASSGSEAGGNSRFAGGVIRFAFSSLDELRRVVDLADDEVAGTDFGTNTPEEFADDLFRLTNYRSDTNLAGILIGRSLEAMVWLRSKGVRFVPNYGRQSAMVGDTRKFFGRMPVEVSGGGAGLVQRLDDAARDAGIEVHFETRAISLIQECARIVGVRARRAGADVEYRAGSVVLASGGFEANAEMRARYLGPGWDLAKVRGSRFNQGDGLRMAIDAGASTVGHWTGCHATGWDLNAPEFGDLNIGDQFQKHSYIFGLLINADGKRFVDEGLDFHSFTYAMYGGEVLRQPGQFAWQVFDAKVKHLLRSEYKIRAVTKVTADTLEEFARKMDGVDGAAFLRTVESYNAAVPEGPVFNHTIKDGRATSGLELAKSNWALRLDKPPFEAYATTCGITFTFGGLRIIPASAQVVDLHLSPIPGLFSAGEMVGGLFYFNYPSGTGLMAGTVFGRIAGASAAAAAASVPR